MGGSKMIPEIPYGAKPPPKLLWSPMIETPEDEAARKAQIKTPKDSFHQIPSETYPCSPFKYRTKIYSFDPGLIPPRIVELPDPASLKKQCPYRKKLEKAKSKSVKKNMQIGLSVRDPPYWVHPCLYPVDFSVLNNNGLLTCRSYHLLLMEHFPYRFHCFSGDERSQFLLSKFIKSAVLKKREIYIWNETLKPERIKVLIKSLASPVELEQLYAAQALGHLGIAEESVIAALYNIVQECDNTPLQYEAARSLALLGCLETCVMKVLIRHMKVASLNRREDTLAALKVALQAWSTTPSFEYYCIGARSSLIRNLKRLVNLQEPLDSITFNAALCLGYLDKSNPIAQEAMFMFLTHVERKKKFQVLVMLVKHMGIMNAIVIRKVLEQLECSPVYKHRADSTDLLTTIGLEIIQQEGLEEDVFNVLLKKISDEPFLIVRQKMALAIEELKMKTRVWEIVERQLEDENDVIRKQAVITLGVLGIRRTSVFFALLEMLELDTNEAVCIQVIRTFSTLGIDNINVRKSLKKKKQGGGILGRESSKALEILDQRSEIQKELMLRSFIIQ